MSPDGMNLALGNNWDATLIDELAGTRVGELYGRLPRDTVGGGRPAMLSSGPADMAQAAAFVRRVHDAGLRFDYLLNASCLDNRELTRAGQRQLHELVDEVLSLGVDRITVSVPWMAQVVRQHDQALPIGVGMFAQVTTVEQLRRWRDLGADRVTLPAPSANRDLPFIRAAAAVEGLDIRLIANNGCLNGCALVGSHGNLASHASQQEHWSRGYFIDTCLLTCKQRRLAEPLELLRADWIRPEDLPFYEELGVSGFKLVDRAFGTEHLALVARVYSDRRFEGNLLDLLPHVSRAYPFQLQEMAAVRQADRLARHLLRPSLANPVGLARLLPLFEGLDFRLDNRALDGFARSLPEEGCRLRDCGACTICATWAERALDFDEEWRHAALERYDELLPQLVSGRLLGYG